MLELGRSLAIGLSISVICTALNPRRACAARVTLCVSVCVSVCYRSRSYSVRFSLRICGIINPRHACAARVTLVCVCVCLCVQASHPLLTQLQDQVDIPMDSVSCSLQNKFGVFRIMA